MRRKWIFKLSLLVLLALNLKVNGQGAPTLGYVTAAPGNGFVILSWQLNAGFTCLGTQIQRSVDGSAFEEIGRIGGICGDLTKPESYSFVDENPIGNTPMMYRLELGTGVFSDTLFLNVPDIGNNLYQVRPNPIEGDSRIYFKSLIRDTFELLIYTTSGNLIQKKTTVKEYFQVNSHEFNPGLYLFIIQSEDKSFNVRGKLMVR